MRKAIVIVVVFSFVLALHQSPVNADGPFNYAALWRSWGAIGRDAYVEGVGDGTFNAYREAANEWLGPGQLFAKPEPEKVGRVREKIFVREQSHQIPAVMTDLYSDPANAYVRLIDMVFIARDKLEGKSVESALQDARKRALEEHRMQERLKVPQ